MTDLIYKRLSHVPVVNYDLDSYEIHCPNCNKGITMNELEFYNYCCNCGITWNKYAKSLYDFYFIHNKKLFKDLVERI